MLLKTRGRNVKLERVFELYDHVISDLFSDCGLDNDYITCSFFSFSFISSVLVSH